MVLEGIVLFPALIVGVIIAAELLFALSTPHSGISHAAHLGGALTGVIVCVAYMRWQALAKLTEERKRIV